MAGESVHDGGAENVDESPEHKLLECLKAPMRSSPVDSDMFLSLEMPLSELISISRSTEGRAKLAELRIVPSLLVLLEQFHKTCQPGYFYSPDSSAEFIGIILLLLKLIRNLCGGDSTNQDAFLEGGGVAILPLIASTLLLSVPRYAHRSEDFIGRSTDVPEKDSLLDRMTARFSSTAISSNQGHISVSPPVGCLQMMLQLLGNFARRGETSQAAAWHEFFPHLFLELAALRVKEICGPLCMVLYTCCQENAKRCCQLCQCDGAALLALLMVSTVDYNSDYAPGNASSGQEQIEWFELLMQQLCFEEPLFPLLFTNLGVPPLKLEVDLLKVNTDELQLLCRMCLETSTLTSLQASLLYILCDCLSSQVSNSPDSSVPGDENQQGAVRLPMPLESVCFMVDILQRAAQRAVKDSELSPVPSLTSASVTVQILGFVLSLLRVSFACDSNSNHADHTKVIKVVLSHGLVELLLSLLEALGTPQAPRNGPTDGMPLEDRLPHTLGTFPPKNPYQGYRRDIVAVIANLSHRNFLVQDRVRENGSLLLVLQQCMVEKDNPFLREWSLWAMRNLLEGNEKNQEEIAELEIKEPVNLPELRQMGLNVEIDPSTHQPHLVNENSSSSQP